VAVSVQFAKLADFGIVHAGLLWEQFRSEFPIVEYRQPLLPVFETFGLDQPLTPPRIELQIAESMELPRLWFLDRENAELIQFQTDRFIHNWRKADTQRPYPRYEAIRERFLSELQALEAYLAQNALGKITPNQCEITYVNVFRVPNGVSALRHLNQIDVPAVGDFEDAALMGRYRFHDDDGHPIGRVLFQASPGFDASGERVIQLNITGRGPPNSTTFPAVLEMLDRARAAVVRTFAAITTDEMHTIWKRRA
jgi:uncharacterized protein (TIGR04255 family)